MTLRDRKSWQFSVIDHRQYWLIWSYGASTLQAGLLDFLVAKTQMAAWRSSLAKSVLALLGINNVRHAPQYLRTSEGRTRHAACPFLRTRKYYNFILISNVQVAIDR